MKQEVSPVLIGAGVLGVVAVVVVGFLLFARRPSSVGGYAYTPSKPSASSSSVPSSTQSHEQYYQSGGAGGRSGGRPGGFPPGRPGGYGRQ